jgi:hypothetical protein
MNRANKITHIALIALVASLAGCGGDSNPLASLAASLVPTAPSAPQAATYSVGGTVRALKGTGLVLQNNGATLPVGANGGFTFAQQLASGTAYSVTVQTQPSDPPQGCTVSNGSGTIGTSAVTNIVVDCTATAASTAVGSAVGQPSTRTIDASGGSLISPDGRLTLTIPPNAVGSATSFTIQPITNQAPGGIGSAYRLGPEGLTFTAPVQISFQYSSADVAGTVPALLEVSSQNAQGYWMINPSVDLNTAQQTITASVTHFSDWSLEEAMFLTPATALLPVGGTLQLTLVNCEPIDDSDDDLLAPLCEPLPASSWAVNGVNGGNAQVGTVSEASTESAVYQAPAAAPPANPVAVSVEGLLGPLGARSKEKFLLVSSVTVSACGASDDNCEWQGTATARFEYVTVAGGFANAILKVSVTWKPTSEFTDQNVGVVTLVPVSGTLTASTDAAGCSVSPSSTPLGGPNEGSLSLDFQNAPAEYSGAAEVPVGVFIETCIVDGQRISGPWEANGGNWFYAPSTPPTSAFDIENGTEIEGQYQSALGSWSWDFQVVSPGSQ